MLRRVPASTLPLPLPVPRPPGPERGDDGGPWNAGPRLSGPASLSRKQVVQANDRYLKNPGNAASGTKIEHMYYSRAADGGNKSGSADASGHASETAAGSGSALVDLEAAERARLTEEIRAWKT